jgi:ribosome-associated protein
MDEELRIHPRLSIPRSELRFRSSRSGGPGGQHANTSDTRVELLFDLEGSPSLGPRQRARLREKLATRIDGRGVLRLVSARFRSQSANREDLIERFVDMLREALHRDPPRKPTRPTRASHERRRRAKEIRSRRKGARKKPDPGAD